MELSKIYYDNDFWNGEFIPEIDELFVESSQDYENNQIIHKNLIVDNGEDENEIYPVSLHPINTNSLIFNRIKKLFAIIDIEYLTCIYNDKKYMIRKDSEFLNEMKLKEYLLIDSKSKYKKDELFIHLMRLNTAFLYLMGYTNITEKDFYVRKVCKNVYYPVTRCERDPSNPLKDNSEFPTVRFLNKWFKPNMVSYEEFPNDKNKTPFQIFTDYVNLIKNMYKDFSIIRSKIFDSIRKFDKNKIAYANEIIKRFNSL